ncbi:hypothetical protein Tco_0928059, partial [Tanacetum coccineum]
MQNRKVLGSRSVAKKVELKAYTCDINRDDGPEPILQDPIALVSRTVREVIGIEDREVTRYKAKLEDRARREEELFTRAPLSSVENKKLKHMHKSRFWGCSDHQKTVTKLYVPVLERAITRLAAGTTNNDANSESNSTQNESTNTSY